MNIFAGWAILTALACAAVLTGCSPQQVAPQEAYTDARATILQAADADEPGTRMNAIEALAETLGDQAGGVYMQAMKDSDALVRIAAVMAVGDVGYKPALPRLLEMAEYKSVEPNRIVLCSVIYALFRLGDDKYAGDLGELLFDQAKAVRAAAAMAMGRMGEQSAVGPLETLYGDEDDPAVQLQIVESLAMLGQVKHQRILESFTKSRYMDDQLAAIAVLQRLRTPQAPAVIRDLLSDRYPPRVRVAAAGGLARMGEVDEAGYKLCLQAARSPQSLLKDPRLEGTEEIKPHSVKSLQCLAATALGWMNRREALNVLHPLLKDLDGSVRVAAAMSILRMLPGYAPPAPVPDESSPATGRAAEKDEPATTRPKLHTAGAKD